MWKLVIFVPNPNLSHQPLRLCLFAQPDCPDTSSSRSFQRKLIKLSEPGLAQPKTWQSEDGQTASYRSHRPGCSTHRSSLHQNHLWLKSILPAVEVREASGDTGKDPEEKLLISNEVEKERSLWEDFDHKNLLRACLFIAAWHVSSNHQGNHSHRILTVP